MKMTIKQWGIVLEAVNLLEQAAIEKCKQHGSKEDNSPEAKKYREIQKVLEILNFEGIE